MNQEKPVLVEGARVELWDAMIWWRVKCPFCGSTHLHFEQRGVVAPLYRALCERGSYFIENVTLVA